MTKRSRESGCVSGRNLVCEMGRTADCQCDVSYAAALATDQGVVCIVHLLELLRPRRAIWRIRRDTIWMVA